MKNYKSYQSIVGMLFILFGLTLQVKAFQVQPTPQLILNLTHKHRPNKVFLSPDGKRVITSSPYDGFKVWSVEEKRLIKTMKGLKNEYAIADDGVHYVAFSEKGRCNLYDVVTDKKKQALDTLEYSIKFSHVKIHSTQNRVALISLNGFYYYDLKTKKPVKLGKDQGYGADEIVFSPNGQWLCSFYNENKRIELWNLRTKEYAYILDFASNAYSLSFSPQGKYLCFLKRHSSKLYFWNPADETLAFKIDNKRKLEAASYHPKKQVVASCDGVSFKLWNPQTKQVFFQQKDDAYALSFNKTGDKIVTIGDSDIKIRNAETGAIVSTIPVSLLLRANVLNWILRTTS